MLIDIQNLYKIYNEGKESEVRALDGVNLTVKAGTVHALKGENGAGKSTLMKCLFGVYGKDGGHIYLEGKETVSYTHLTLPTN